MTPISREHSETTEIAASPDQVYDAVRQLERMGEWSPENQGGSWIKGDGTSVGDQFEGKNQLGDRVWTAVAEVTRCDPGTAFCFTVGGLDDPVAEWGYFFEAGDGGTQVTETWAMRRLPPTLADAPAERVDGRAAMVAEGMARTLVGLKNSFE